MKKERVLKFLIFILLLLASLTPYYCGSTRSDSGTDVKHKDTTGQGDEGHLDVEITDGGYSLVTVYNIQGGAVPENTLVEIRDVVVTTPTFKSSSRSTDNDSFFVIEKTGGAYSGIYIFFKNNKADVAIGDLVDIRGTYMEYYNNSQIVATEVIKKGTSPLPAPTDVDPAKVKTGGEESENYEGVLVRVINVEVTNDSVLGTDGKPHGDFEVTGGLIVGKFFRRNYKAKNGDRLDSIIGVLNYSFDQMRLQPRDDNDITIGALSDGGSDISTDTEIKTGITIYDIQDVSSTDHPAENSTVRIEDVVVTGEQFNASTNLYGMFVEEKQGGAYSGIMVVYGKTAGLGPFTTGDVVTIEGTYKEYYGMSEISATNIIKTGRESPPKPVVVNPADVATGGSDAEKYEGVLIRVENVEVLSANPDAANEKDYKEFMITGNLRVNDKYSYTYTSQRRVGDRFDYIVGILDYNFGEFKLNPRSDDDLALSGMSVPDGGTIADTGLDTGGDDTGGVTKRCASLLVISQVKVAGLTDDGGTNHQDEFVELYNAENNSLDLTGYKVQYKSATGTQWQDLAVLSGRTIDPYKFLLIASDTAVLGGISPDITYSSSRLGLSATGGNLRIIDDNGDVVDRVAWGTGDSPEGSPVTAPRTGSSIIRKAKATSTAESMKSGGADEKAGHGVDTENNSTDFVLLDVAEPNNSLSEPETNSCIE